MHEVSLKIRHGKVSFLLVAIKLIQCDLTGLLMAIKFWRLSQSLSMKQSGEVAKHNQFGLRGKKREGEEIHTILLENLQEILPRGNLTSWKSSPHLSLFNFFLHSSTLPELFSLHFPLPAQQRVLGVPLWIFGHVLTIFSQRMELHVGGEQENGVSRKKTTCPFFQLEKLALQKDGKTNR